MTNNKNKKIIYGFLISGANKEDEERFKKFLLDAKAINFKEVDGSVEITTVDKIKNQLKASSIKVIAIGHGYDDGKINGKHKIVDIIKAVGEEIGESSSRISEFRLQVCSQAKYALEKSDEEKEKLRSDISEALKSYKSERILFCCPREFSYIKGGTYQDTNAISLEDYDEKSKSKTLENGPKHSLIKDIVLVKEKEKAI
jgi:hypothetical protein